MTSRAIIVSDGMASIAFWCTGSDLMCEIDNTSQDAVSLGIVPEQPGVYVWEGTYVMRRCGEYGVDYETDPVGNFRDCTPDELKAFLTGNDPWEDDLGQAE